jgi:hypothetical protein
VGDYAAVLERFKAWNIGNQAFEAEAAAERDEL